MASLKSVRRRLAHVVLLATGFDLASGRWIKRHGGLIQLGTKYGGWVVPASLLDSRSICYCAGCGEDISFDLALIEKFGCEVFGFDPTPRAIAYVRQRAAGVAKYHFLEIGLWDRAETLKFFAPKDPTHVSHSALNIQKTDRFFEAPVKRLSVVMAELGHSRVDLLKLDIEGAEYKVLSSLIEDRADVRILCVEFDEYLNPCDAGYLQRVRAAIGSLLDAGYEIACCQGYANYTFV